MEAQNVQPRGDAAGRALRIPELVQVIFATMEVTHEEDPKVLEKRVTLGRAAQTCRGFSATALDALWRTMPSLVPLLKIVGLVQGLDGRYALQEEFLSNNWDRLETYARRIKHLNDFNPPVIDDLAALRIAQHMHAKSLLPLLESLSYTFSPHVHLLISPRLRQVTIKDDSVTGFSPEEWKVVDFFHALAVDAPLLERFVFGSRWTLTVPSAVSRLRNLLIITLQNALLDQTILLALLSLPKLDHLYVRFRTSHPRLSAPPTVLKPSSLKRLVASGASTTISDLLSHLTTTPIQSFDIRIQLSTQNSPEESWRAIIRHVKSWPDCVTVFWLRCMWNGPPMEPRNLTRDWSILQPLLKLHVLTMVNIQYPLDLDPSDQDYLEMAHAWPKLTSFSMILSSAHSKPRASISTLESFANYCPQLRSLAIHVDFSSLTPSPHISSHSLKHFSGYGGLLVDAALLARYLNALFPELGSVAYATEYPKWGRDAPHDERKVQWERVESFVKLFQAAREDDDKRRRRSKVIMPPAQAG